MRTIKFRGKASRKDKDMWLYGDLIKIDDSYHILEKDDMIEDGHHIRQDSDRPTWVDEKTIGQFTGLLDKNGKEIYEGDIVNITDEEDEVLIGHGFVQWSDDWGGWYLDDNEDGLGTAYGLGTDDLFKINFDKYLAVIGNIYDNQELL